MGLSLRRWKPGQLLLGWATYWVGLIGVTMAPAVGATWRATRPESHGTVSASFDNAKLSYTVVENGVKTWAGATPMSTALLWVIVPPLALWLIWLLVRQRPATEQADVVAGSRDRDALPPGAVPASEWRERQRERVSLDQGRVRTPNP